MTAPGGLPPTMPGVPARLLALIAVAAVAAAACTGPAGVTTSTTGPTTTVTVPSTTAPPAPTDLVAEPARHPMTGRLVYFVMPDRFENGDPSNDTGGLDPGAGPLVHGHLPERTGWYHGGDLVGLTSRLDYLAGLGVSAIWITPPFVNRTVQGNGTIEGSSAGYHGYWQIDWSRIDPHLGSDADMLAFIEAAHERSMLVIFDIVANHTGDVITFDEGRFTYIGTTAAPFLDASGRPFDPGEMAGSPDFPELDPAISFPYTPTFAAPEDATVKSPEWLNDVTLYHNRGNSTFQGESSLFGDFFGLDDLFSQHPRVIEGMIELYSDVIRRYPVDGFRVDTAKHVHDEFWAAFVPAIRKAAADAGREDFFVFAEVFGEDPIFNSRYSTVLGFDSVLDFQFDGAVRRYVLGGDAGFLAQAFDADDWYTDEDSNASMLVKFLGNHDLGRLGYFVSVGSPGASDEVKLTRMQLALDLMFLSRGVPLVYYGDEQGFTGDGGDQRARQTMFPSVTPEYVDDVSIGTGATPADDNFDPGHPLYRHIAGLAALRRDHPALAAGAQIPRNALAGTLAFSRIDRDERVEYLVATNSGSTTTPVTFRSATPDAVFSQVYPVGGDTTVTARADGTVTIELSPVSAVVLVADRKVPVPDTAATVSLVRPAPGTEIPTFRYRIEAELGDDRLAEVTFSARVDGGEPFLLGVDDAPPYRVYWDSWAFSDGSVVEFIAVVSDGSDTATSGRVEARLGTRR
jgi:alpha-amylase